MGHYTEQRENDEREQAKRHNKRIDLAIHHFKAAELHLGDEIGTNEHHAKVRAKEAVLWLQDCKR